MFYLHHITINQSTGLNLFNIPNCETDLKFTQIKRRQQEIEIVKKPPPVIKYYNEPCSLYYSQASPWHEAVSVLRWCFLRSGGMPHWTLLSFISGALVGQLGSGTPRVRNLSNLKKWLSRERTADLPCKLRRSGRGTQNTEIGRQRHARCSYIFDIGHLCHGQMIAIKMRNSLTSSL